MMFIFELLKRQHVRVIEIKKFTNEILFFVNNCLYQLYNFRLATAAAEYCEQLLPPKNYSAQPK